MNRPGRVQLPRLASRVARDLLTTDGLGWVLVTAAGLAVVGGILAWAVEPRFGTAADGIWWSLGTITTLGRGAGGARARSLAEPLFG